MVEYKDPAALPSSKARPSSNHSARKKKQMNSAMLKQLNKVIIPMKQNESQAVHPMFKGTSEHKHSDVET